MSRIVGIDIRHNLVQAAVLRSSYRRLHLEGLSEVDPRNFSNLGEAVAAVVSGFALHGEAFAVGIGGDSSFIHRLELPPAALKQVEEVVPYELEAQIPVDFESLVYDCRVLPRRGADSSIDIIAAAAPIDAVKSRIAEVSSALRHEPERIGVGPLPLGNLAGICADLKEGDYYALVDFGEETTELVVVHQGVAVFARTLSVGVAALPESAPDMVRSLRQTLVSWAASNDAPVKAVFLCGGGARAVGIVDYLAAHLQIDVELLPALSLELADPQWAAELGRFAKAIGLALSLRAGSKDLNLRQGELTYQRGYGFLRDKVPLLVGLGAVMIMSFVFSAWAESRSLSKENDALSEAMALLSRDILREETDDVERVLDLLDTGTKLEKDPQPEIDGFELAIALADKIPKDFEHDVAELELQRGHVNLRGLVNSTDQAQKIADALGEVKCFKNIKVSKITQEIKGDRQKYSMEFDVKCEEPKKPVASEDEEEEEE